MAKFQNTYTLLATGLILEAVGALLHLRLPTPAAWIMIVGGALIALSYLMSGSTTRSSSVRGKRLDRMGFLSGLGYLISGGFCLDGQVGVWILLFTIATVLSVYSIFVKDRMQKKHDEATGNHPDL